MTEQVQQLADAIRQGARLRPQAFHRYSSNGASCALGAAAEAIGIKIDTEDPFDALLQAFPVLCYREAENGMRLFEWIFYSNDELRLTREEIADKLSTLVLLPPPPKA